MGTCVLEAKFLEAGEGLEARDEVGASVITDAVGTAGRSSLPLFPSPFLSHIQCQQIVIVVVIIIITRFTTIIIRQTDKQRH